MTNSIVPLQLHLWSGPFIHSGGGSVVMKLQDIEFYGLDEERGRGFISFVIDIRCKRVGHSLQVFCRLSSGSPRLRLQFVNARHKSKIQTFLEPLPTQLFSNYASFMLPLGRFPVEWREIESEIKRSSDRDNGVQLRKIARVKCVWLSISQTSSGNPILFRILAAFPAKHAIQFPSPSQPQQRNLIIQSDPPLFVLACQCVTH